MAFGVEIREPFMDRELLEFAVKIPPRFKVDPKKKNLTKLILREAFKDILPDYIYSRAKATLMEGAGGGPVNRNQGIFFENSIKYLSSSEAEKIIKENPSYQLNNIEDAYYFSLFRKMYSKAEFTQLRPFCAKSEIKLKNWSP